MGNYSEAFIGIDTAKLRNAVAVAEAGRRGEIRYLGEIDTSEIATRRLVAGLAARYRRLTFCYEAGRTGYGLQRLIESLGHACIVVAPSLIPKKAGDRVKINRRDAPVVSGGLARLLRAGELTSVWVPDARHEAMRELTRARDAAKQDLTRKRQQVSSMLWGRTIPASRRGTRDTGPGSPICSSSTPSNASCSRRCRRRSARLASVWRASSRRSARLSPTGRWQQSCPR